MTPEQMKKVDMLAKHSRGVINRDFYTAVINSGYVPPIADKWRRVTFRVDEFDEWIDKDYRAMLGERLGINLEETIDDTIQEGRAR